MDKNSREQMRQNLRSMIETMEDNKWTRLTFSVRYELWSNFKACCYFQGIEPLDALTNYMVSISPPQVVEYAKKLAGGKKG